MRKKKFIILKWRQYDEGSFHAPVLCLFTCPGPPNPAPALSVFDLTRSNINSNKWKKMFRGESTFEDTFPELCSII